LKSHIFGSSMLSSLPVQCDVPALPTTAALADTVDISTNADAIVVKVFMFFLFENKLDTIVKL
jgi:hypothetical protein